MTALALKTISDSDPFHEDYSRNGATLSGAGLTWLNNRRRAAMNIYLKNGLPTRRTEAWKYTDLTRVAAALPEPASRLAGSIENGNVFGDFAGARFVIVNGFLHDVTGADGIEFVDLGKLDGDIPGWIEERFGLMASGADQIMGAVSLALMRGGMALRVREKAAIHLDFLTRNDGGPSHSRVLIVLEQGASLHLLESHSGKDATPSFSNVGMEIILKENARLDHFRIQTGAAHATHITSLGMNLAADAHYQALCSTFGAEISRLDANIKLAGPGATAKLNNIAILKSGIADVTTIVDHASPHTTSRQLFKNVVAGHGRAVNQGRVAVRQGAVKSDSHQLFKSLLLSAHAEADAKPELEIFADDVVCGHGTAIGALDADSLFYLRARGIPEADAKSLLVLAFLEEVMDGLATDGIRDALLYHLDAALESLGRTDS